MFLPQDVFLLLSVMNTALRDKYASLDELCEEEDVEKESIVKRLAEIGYEYQVKQNAFVSKG
jgi:hypothetical protein